MTFSKNDFELSFLTKKDIPEIDSLILYYDDNLGRASKDFDTVHIYELISNPKAARRLRRTLKDFFTFSSDAIETILSTDQMKLLEKKDITKASELRLWLFTEVGKTKNGFIDPNKVDSFLDETATSLKLSSSQISELLWRDLEKNQKLQKNVDYPKVDPFQVMGRHNWWIYETAVKNSERVTFKIQTGIRGDLVKLIIQWCRKSYVYAELKEISPEIVIDIAGPSEDFGKPYSYGNSLAYVFRRIFANLISEKSSFVVEIEYGVSKRKSLLTITSSNLPHLDVPYEVLAKAVRTLDSEVEADFYRSFTSKNRNNWTIDPEGEALITDNQIVIPDFLAKRGSQKVYIEIVGFWTPQYAKKKFSQYRLIAIENPNIPLLLLVDQTIDMPFEALEELGISVLRYKRTIEARAVQSILNKQFSDLTDRIDSIDDLFEKHISSQKNELITLLNLQKLFSLHSRKELDQVIPKLKDLYSQFNYSYIPQVGFLSNILLSQVKEFLIKAVPSTTPLHSLETLFKDKYSSLSPSLTSFLDFFGFKTSYADLFDVSVYPPT
ncbi:MAG: DUF790 family protein [Candidatus Heimdallarchaeota archaeon]|nr:DUF790 family protein [Candidatus Heimdallarchaeota archaeon]MCK5047857.1 DUF790 family protein [Candidatus Heimdallarchaeota archaeon]